MRVPLLFALAAFGCGGSAAAVAPTPVEGAGWGALFSEVNASSYGIEATRVIATGFGETKPVASNDTEEGRAQNRRTEMAVL